MKNDTTESITELLAFSLQDILGLPKSTGLQVERISGPTTALTLRVSLPGASPQSYFVKTLKKDAGPGAHLRLGLREVRFYALIDRLSPQPYPAIPRCLKHFISEEGDQYYLVLEDLSGTHQSHAQVDFTDLGNWQIALAALAEFHRAFTGRLQPDQIQAHADGLDQVDGYIEKLEKAFEKFTADQRGRVSDSVLALLEGAIPLIRAFEVEKAKRIAQNRLVTILNRDAHLKNFLYPRSPGEKAVIVDWQFWGLGTGTFDLRHLLGSALSPEMRGHQEGLVRYYYDRYTDGLESDYAWEDCWDDYRKGIIDNLFMPVWQYTGFGWPYEQWCQTLEAAVENYHALNCGQIPG